MKLFIDDERPLPEGEDWYVVRTIEQAINFIFQWGEQIKHISFDHDSGDPSNSFKCVAHYVLQYYNHECMPMPTVSCHSANPVGKKSILDLLDSWCFDIVEFDTV